MAFNSAGSGPFGAWWIFKKQALLLAIATYNTLSLKVIIGASTHEP